MITIIENGKDSLLPAYKFRDPLLSAKTLKRVSYADFLFIPPDSDEIEVTQMHSRTQTHARHKVL